MESSLLLLLALMLLPAAALPLLTTALPGLVLVTAGRGSIAAGMLLLALSSPVTGSQHDLELVQLVPFGVGALPLRDPLQLLQAGPGRIRCVRRIRRILLGFVHGGIISLFDLKHPVTQ